jgi:hypothetical protein
MSEQAKLLPCPFCGGAMQPRDALWPSEGDTDGIIHASPTDCPLPEFSVHVADEGVSVAAAWNTRASLVGVEQTIEAGGHIIYAPLRHTLDDYVAALSGDGPLAFEWNDKPHRLIYDLVKALRPNPAALPPLRAREEIVRAIVAADGYDIDEERRHAAKAPHGTSAEILKSAENYAVAILSRTAGQAWREPADNQTTDELWKDSVGL